MKKALILFAVLSILNLQGQYAWSWEELPPMPKAMANNAVASAQVGATSYVYSFGGIDTSRTLQGIGLDVMRLDVQSGTWQELADMPDTLGKVAAGASTVGDIIYIMGGYYVFEGAPFELSSDKVHRYDPATDSYLPDGAPIPLPIDDHVQAVWRDSLIYLVTGWSDTENVPNVQIYDPAFDSWQAGTSTPNGVAFEAFGASGTIIGDTIYYLSGAGGFTFSASTRMRKGVINSNDPTQIDWSLLDNDIGVRSYRSACAHVDETIFWVGGSEITYNYDGLAYSNGNPVSPLPRIVSYNPEAAAWSDMSWQPEAIMDLRGIAQISTTDFVICGGMQAGPVVTNRAFRLSYGGISALSEYDDIAFSIWPNSLALNQTMSIQTEYTGGLLQVYNLGGALLHQGTLRVKTEHRSPTDLGIRAPGVYIMHYSRDGDHVTKRLICY